MKTWKPMMIMVCLSAGLGCRSSNLETAKAEQLIKEAYDYPHPAKEMIFTGDINEAKRLLDLDMESTGMLTISRTQSVSEIGNPWIFFTDKGKPFLLPTPNEDTKYKRQNVKVADIDFDKILGIAMGEDGKTAIVRYTTIYKNLTPFWKLYKDGSNKPVERKAFFMKYDSGWHLEKKPGAMMTGFI